MRKRIKAPVVKDRSIFLRTANRTRDLNVKPTIRRGGIRL